MWLRMEEGVEGGFRRGSGGRREGRRENVQGGGQAGDGYEGGS